MNLLVPHFEITDLLPEFNTELLCLSVIAFCCCLALVFEHIKSYADFGKLEYWAILRATGVALVLLFIVLNGSVVINGAAEGNAYLFELVITLWSLYAVSVMMTTRRKCISLAEINKQKPANKKDVNLYVIKASFGIIAIADFLIAWLMPNYV